MIAPFLLATLAMSPADASAAAKLQHRPIPSYIQRDPTEHEVTRMFAPGGAPLPIYLNRHGGTYQCGDDDSSRNLSSVVCGSNASGQLGAYTYGDSSWNQMLGCVRDEFSRFNVVVTDLEPTSGDYVEAVVGGTPGQAGMPDGVGGVAPFTCGLVPAGIVYAFADVYGNDPQSICETVAQEVSHAFGLDHEFLCEDPMTYLSGCGNKTFQDQNAQCGEFQPRQCSCGGSTQNSVQQMLSVLGASDGTVQPPPPVDHAPPTVSITSPADAAVLPANSTINVVASASDDVGLPTVELVWDFTGETMFCPASTSTTGSYSCAQSGTNYTWTIQVGEGSRTFRVHVRDVAGNDVTTADRTIWLSADGSGPPNDLGPPSVIVASPADGAVLPANTSIEVIAQVGDDSGLSRVELLWPFSQGDFLCPMSQDQNGDGTPDITCTVNGATYTWGLTVGEGGRPFTVKATDLVGNVTLSTERTITLTAGASPPADDANTGDSTIDGATPLACGDQVTGLIASDADWFSVNAPAGQDVTVSIAGDARGNVGMVATKGASPGDVITDGANAVQFTGDGSKVSIAVLPNNVDAGGYKISVTCAEPKVKGAKGGCASSGTPVAWVGLLLVLGLRRRRR